jgi:hypothetical protein
MKQQRLSYEVNTPQQTCPVIAARIKWATADI